jgi:hypothetical protein
MPELKKSTQTLTAPNGIQIDFVSDNYGGQLLDTEVKISGKTLCTIAGTDIPQFKEDFIALVVKYRI